MKRATQKNASGLTAADIARLSPAARAKAQSAMREAEAEHRHEKEKRFEVSFFSKRHKKRLTIPFPLAAATKSAAISEGKARQSGNQKDYVNWLAHEVKSNPWRGNPAKPYFCADCDDELVGKVHVMSDGRAVCDKCAARARELRRKKLQGKLFEEQSALFQNPSVRRNIEMGYYAHGIFHPIRASKDYNEFRAGDFDTKPEVEARRLKRDAERMREWYSKEEKREAERFAKRHKSLSQFVRGRGGIAYKPRVKGSLKKSDDLRDKRGGATELGMLSPKETGTTGLLNKSNRQGSQRYSAEYMMDAANAEGYRDARGEEFSHIGDFLAAVADDATGRKKLYSNQDYQNPMKKKTAKSKAASGKRRNANATRSAAKPKKNLLGFGKEAKKRKRRKARAKAAYYAELARNPKQRGISIEIRQNGKVVSSAAFASVDAVEKFLAGKQRKNPMHPLEVGSHLAAILGGTHHLSQMMKSKKKKARRPSASAAGKRLAQRKHGHVRGKTKTVKRTVRARNPRSGEIEWQTCRECSNPVRVIKNKLAFHNRMSGKLCKGSGMSIAKRNSAGEIFENFTGMPSTKVTTGYVAADAPKNVDQLGPVVQMTIENPNGKLVTIGSERDGTARTIRGQVVRFHNGAVQLCAVKKPNGRARFVVGVRAADREKFLQKYPWANGKVFSYGPVAEVIYRARKPHLYNGDQRTHTFYHILGEEGGRRPTAMIKNGCPTLKYGDYDIQREGIRN